VHVWHQHVAPWGTLGNSRMQLPLLLIPTPMTSSLLAPDWLRPRPRCCCCCCRNAAVGTPYERRADHTQKLPGVLSCKLTVFWLLLISIHYSGVISRPGLLARERLCSTVFERLCLVWCRVVRSHDFSASGCTLHVDFTVFHGYLDSLNGFIFFVWVSFTFSYGFLLLWF